MEQKQTPLTFNQREDWLISQLTFCCAFHIRFSSSTWSFLFVCFSKWNCRKDEWESLYYGIRIAFPFVCVSLQSYLLFIQSTVCKDNGIDEKIGKNWAQFVSEMLKIQNMATSNKLTEFLIFFTSKFLQNIIFSYISHEFPTTTYALSMWLPLVCGFRI